MIIQSAASARAYALTQSSTGSDTTRADDEKMLRESIKWIGVVENEGLQVLEEYEFHMTGAAVASLRLRKLEDHAKYWAKVEAWRLVVRGGSFEAHQLGLFQQSLFRV